MSSMERLIFQKACFVVRWMAGRTAAPLPDVALIYYYRDESCSLRSIYSGDAISVETCSTARVYPVYRIYIHVC